MHYEGDPGVLENLIRQKEMLARGKRLTDIRLLLLGLGGTMRGIEAAGRCVTLHEWGLIKCFDHLLGVSTTAPVFAYAAAGQAELVPSLYLEEGTSRKFISIVRGLLGGYIVNCDYAASVYRGATGKRLDQAQARRARPELYFAVTCAEGGDSHFINAKTLPDIVDGIRASIAIPISSRSIAVAGMQAYDGSVGSPMPVRDAVRVFNPTDILIFANREEREKPTHVVERLYTQQMCHALPMRIVEGFERKEERFKEELGWLRGACPVRFGIVWSDGSLRALTSSKTVLEAANSNAQAHMKKLLRTAV